MKLSVILTVCIWSIVVYLRLLPLTNDELEFGVGNLNLEWGIWIWCEEFELGVRNLNLEWGIWIWSYEIYVDIWFIIDVALVGHRTGQIKATKFNYYLICLLSWLPATTFVQSFQYYPFRSHLPMHLFGNFITNTSSAWKCSISWNKTEGYLLLTAKRFTRTRLLGQSRIWDMHVYQNGFIFFILTS
jgi:hypothetical protein